jgi:nitrate/nitrite transporter NarK
MAAALSAFVYAYVLSHFYRTFLAVIAGDLTRDLGLGPKELGDLSAIWFITFALMQFPVGVWLDRFGPRRTTAGLFLFAVVGATWFAFAQGFHDALAAMALIGIGCAPILMGSLYYFGRIFPPERFGFFAALLIGLGSLGNLLGATPLAWAATHFGWRASMVAIAAATALAAAAVWLVIRDPERVTAEDDRNSGLLNGLAAVFRIRAILLITPLIFLNYAGVAAVRSLWIAPFFGELHGFDSVQKGHAAMLMAVAMSIGAFVYGPLERVLGGPKAAVIPGAVGGAILMGLIAVFGASSSVVALVLHGLLGCIGMFYGALMAHARLFFPSHLLGRGVSIVNFLSIGGAGVMQWVSGRLVETSIAAGSPPAQTYAGLYWLFAATVAASLALYVFAPARPGR